MQPARTSVEFLNSGKLPASLPFSEAVRHGDTLYLSGQIGILPGTLQLAPGGSRPRLGRRCATSGPRSPRAAVPWPTSSNAP